MGSTRWRHGENVTFVGFTAEDKGVITVSQDNIIRLWDRDTGKEIRRFDTKAAGQPPGILPPQRIPGGMGSTQLATISLSKDGKTLATTMPANILRLWDVDTGTQIRQINGPQGGAVAILLSPDGKSVAAHLRSHAPSL